MELVTKKKLLLYSGNCHPALAEDIANHLGIELGEPNLRTFPNGESHCRFNESLRGADVFIVQSHCEPVNGSIMEQLVMLDAAMSLQDLERPPNNRLKPLKGDRQGQHSIRINDQFRICFIWTPDGPTQVEIVDYH